MAVNRVDKIVNDLKSRVRNAVKKNLISKNDIRLNNEKRLLNFIKFSLVEMIDRKVALDVLRLLDYDANTPWADLQTKYGEFECLEDIALCCILRHLIALGLDKYSGYIDEEKSSPVTVEF